MITIEQKVQQAQQRIIDVIEALEDKDDVCVQCIFEDAYKAFEEWRPMIIGFLSEGIGKSPTNDLFNLVVRPTSIGTEYYLRENISGDAKSLVKRIEW